jgi:hypothetical protein
MEGNAIKGEVLVSLENVKFCFQLMSKLVGLNVHGREIITVHWMSLNGIKVEVNSLISDVHSIILAACTLGMLLYLLLKLRNYKNK